MTKAELISALEWFKDDAELHIIVPHEALDDLHEVMSLDSARYNLIPPRVELVAKRTAQETRSEPTVEGALSELRQRLGMEPRPAHTAAHDCACEDCVKAETSPVPAPRGPCPECKGAGWRDGGFPGYSGICPDCGGSGLNRGESR